MSSISNEIIDVNEWVPSAVVYTKPKVTKSGGKSVGIISTKSKSALSISTPLMMTWGISDFVDEKTGEFDGTYSMSLKFPNDDYSTTFLDKLKEFESQILDYAVKNSEEWFGKVQPREQVEHNFSRFLKYTKVKGTNSIDGTKPPSIRAKVPKNGDKWNIKVYDPNLNELFPGDSKHMSPIDFVPKMSKVAAVLQCGGIWFGGKGWGVTWKVVRCVVEPPKEISNKPLVLTPVVADDEDNDEEQKPKPKPVPKPKPKTVPKTVTKTVPEPVSEPVPEPVSVPVSESVSESKPKKKVVKKNV